MKAITIWQPWASLLACGAKKYETRGWYTHYRGPIAIHAATRKPDIHDLSGAAHHAIMQTISPLVRSKAQTTMYLPLELLPRGVVIATGELVGCYRIAADEFCKSRVLVSENELEHFGHDEISEQDAEFLFGDFTPGRYAWEIVNVKMLPEPVPCRGKQGLWNWEAA